MKGIRDTIGQYVANQESMLIEVRQCEATRRADLKAALEELREHQIQVINLLSEDISEQKKTRETACEIMQNLHHLVDILSQDMAEQKKEREMDRKTLQNFAKEVLQILSDKVSNS